MQDKQNQARFQPIFKPSELIALFGSILGKQDEFSKLTYLRGIYRRKPDNPQWSFSYGILRDEATQEEITLRIPKTMSGNLSDGNLVTVGGTLGRKIDPQANIRLTFIVTRIEKVQEQVVNRTDQEKANLRQKKSQLGFHNVDGTLEQLFLAGKRPNIALLFASNSITRSDFEAGLQAARSAIIFQEFRVDFFKTESLCDSLQDIDTQGFDAIAVMRGGGSGIEHLDDVAVLETLCGMKTPVIAAVGHPDEHLVFKTMADKTVATPTAFGQYLNDLVERTTAIRTRSHALQLEAAKKQVADQMDALKKHIDNLETDRKAERAAFQKQLDEQAKAHREERTVLLAKQNQIFAEQEKIRQEERGNFQKQLNAQNTLLAQMRQQLAEQKADFARRVDEWGIERNIYTREEKEANAVRSKLQNQNIETRIQLDKQKQLVKTLYMVLSVAGACLILMFVILIRLLAK